MKRQRRVVNLVGFTGSGVTSASKYLASEYGFKRVDPLAIVSKPYPQATNSFRHYNNCQRELLTEMPEAMTLAVMCRTGAICIDGLLVPSHTQKLQEKLGDNFATIALDCHPELRAKRLREDRFGPVYGIGISAARLAEEEAEAFCGTGKLDINIPDVMAMHAERGAQLNANRPLLSVRLQLENALGQLGFDLTHPR